jgi:competence protein ComEC
MSKHLRLGKVPLFRFLVPFIAGILCAYYLNSFILKQTKLLFCLFIVVGIFSLILYFVKSLERFFDFFLFSFVFLLAMNGTFMRLNIYEAKSSELSYSGVIYDMPQIKSNSIFIPVKVQNPELASLSSPQSFKVNLYTTKDSSLIEKLSVGDKIIFSAQLKKIKNSGNPFEFDYKRFMYNRGVVYQAYAPDSCMANLGYHGNLPLRRLSARIQSDIVDLFENPMFSENAKALIIALTVGNKEYISDDLRASFTNSGAVHVLAVSGLHVGIIYLILNYLLVFMNRSRRLRVCKTLLVILVIWGYALITGLSPSVARAALMFTLINIGTSLNRDISFYNILAGAALIMLVINPLNIFEVGFQLSFLAVGGIVYFQPLIYNWFSFSNIILDYLYKLFTLSLAAQLITAPLTIYYFNQFPTYFWLTNILIIPLVFILVFLSVAFVAFSWSQFLTIKIGWLLNGLANLTNLWVEFVDSLPGSVIENISVGFLSLVILYFLMYELSQWLNYKKNLKLIGSLFSILILFAVNINNNVGHLNKNQFVVYNVAKQSAIGFYTNDKNYLVVSNAIDVQKDYTYAVKNHWIKLGILNKVEIVSADSLKSRAETTTKNVRISIISINKKKVVVFSNLRMNEKELESISGDILLVGANTFPPKTRLKSHCVIVDGSVNTYLSGLWANYALENGIKFHDTKINGAFILDS